MDKKIRYICHLCFLHGDFQNRIVSLPESSNMCDLCGKNDGHVVDSHSQEDMIPIIFQSIESSISSLVNLYTEGTSEDDILYTQLQNDWTILNPFRVFDTRIQRNFYNEILKEEDVMRHVASIELNDSNHEKALLDHNTTWKDFKTNIQFQNRYHPSGINKTVLKILIESLSDENVIFKTSEVDVWYRARFVEQRDKVIDPEKMGMPPEGRANAGRLNSAGTRVLYLADSGEGAAAEIRAGFDDQITIAEARFRQELKLLNLDNIDRIDPFLLANREGDQNELLYLFNKQVMKDIAEDLKQTSGGKLRYSSEVEYAVSNYISDFVKSLTNEEGKTIFHGIKYSSAMDNKKVNIAIFESEAEKTVSFYNANLKTITRVTHLFTGEVGG